MASPEDGARASAAYTKDQMQSILDSLQFAVSAMSNALAQTPPVNRSNSSSEALPAGRRLSLDYETGPVEHPTTPAFVVEPSGGRFLVSAVSPVPREPKEEFCRCVKCPSCRCLLTPHANPQQVR
jgi:hypothetical protein